MYAVILNGYVEFIDKTWARSNQWAINNIKLAKGDILQIKRLKH